MLVLTRKIGDSIVIGDNVTIQVVKVKGNQVRLGINAPKETKIFRKEILDNIKQGIPKNVSQEETSNEIPLQSAAQ